MRRAALVGTRKMLLMVSVLIVSAFLLAGCGGVGKQPGGGGKTTQEKTTQEKTQGKMQEETTTK